tara:strand:+ start:1195 stop:1374 length:180 start_codon:yes stop_codon:yes gene_type:complete
MHPESFDRRVIGEIRQFAELFPRRLAAMEFIGIAAEVINRLRMSFKFPPVSWPGRVKSG